MPTTSDVETALSTLSQRLMPGDMFSARQVAHELGADDDASAKAVARVLATLPHVVAKTIGAHVNPDALWGFG